MNRADAIAAIVSTGKTPAQAEAFLDVLGSGFRRRGWVQGDPLSRAEVDAKMMIFVGSDDADTV